jgi:hypothetical protein
MVPAARGAVLLPGAAMGSGIQALFGIPFRESRGIEIPFLKPRFGFCEFPHLRAGRMPVQIWIAKK